MADIQVEADTHYKSRFGEIGKLLRIHWKASNLGHYQWSEAIEDMLGEMPLEVSLDGVYVRRDEMHWEILLGTGGPADRVLVVCDLEGNVESASYQYQDWYQPWTDARDQDYEVVRNFATVYYFSSLREVVEGEGWGE
jgi:hypothetical protein